MKKNAIALLLLLTAAIFVAGGAVAAVDDDDKPLVSLTPYVGYGFWSGDLGLDDSFMYGGRGAIHFLKWLSLEGTYGRSGSDRAADGVGVDLDHYGVDLVAELLPSARFVPYVTAGWSQLDYKAEGADRKLPLNGAEIGIGVKTRLGGNNANYRALRFDLRDVMTNLNPDFPNGGSTTHNIVATLGVQFAFGKSSRDSDNDGVRDRDDDCDATPAGAVIDASGCPTDSDGDGVVDGLDKCDATVKGALVDASGCPIDSDGDGVYDGLDKCPDTAAGVAVDDRGCPTMETVIKVETLQTAPLASTSEIAFATDSAVIGGNPGYLDTLGAALASWPELQIEIAGHADDTGSPAYNQTLSEERARAVRDYLVKNHPGIAGSQIRLVGYGETVPLTDNTTDEGRAANRRVEIKVLNSGDLSRETEVRELIER